MNVPSTLSCLCTDCPGVGCLCGCNDFAPLSALAAGVVCECGPRRGCEAAEGGCLCTLVS